MAVDPLPQIAFFGGRRWQLALVEAEVVLGLSLVSGWWRVGVWWLTVGGFGIFAAVSGYLGAIGQASCGCFGASVKIPPLLTFAFDIVAVACLLLWRPAGVFDLRAAGASIRQIGWPVFGAVVAVIATGSSLVYYYGSVDDAWAALRHQPCSVEPAVTDVGTAPVGTVREVGLHFFNHTDTPVRVLGGSSNCTCVTMATSSIVVPARESRSIPVRIVFTGSGGKFRRRVSVYYSFANYQREAIAQIAGRVEDVP